MRHPSVWMVSSVLTFMLVGCTTNEQAEPKEPTTQTPSNEDQPVVQPNDSESNPNTEEPDASQEEPVTEEPATTDEPVDEQPPTTLEPAPEPEPTPSEEPTDKAAPEAEGKIANLDLGTLVLVNKQIALPENYKPSDLVPAQIDFVSTASGERKMMRAEAARAIEALMLGAKADGMDLKGTSAFRSYAYQVQLFNAYVARDGKEEAMKYSAQPGHSEHQSGLAIDVSSASVNYQLTQSLGQTTEGKWLADHAHEYGFIIRYPRQFEAETGYMYEPWHLRYIGIEHAAKVRAANEPLDRYLEEYMK